MEDILTPLRVIECRWHEGELNNNEEGVWERKRDGRVELKMERRAE